MKWKKEKLVDIIEKPLSGEWGTDCGDIPVIRTTNFTNSGRLDLTNVVYRNIDSKTVERKRLIPGDIIIEKSGGSPTQPVGRVVFFDYADGTYVCNNFTSVLRPKKNVAPKYLFWSLFAAHQTGRSLQYQNKTTGIINLKLERYTNELDIPLPPLYIQQQIADTLDKADALRRKDQELLQKYDELAQSIFYDMFGDPVRNERGWPTDVLQAVGRLDRGVSKHRPRNAPELLGGPYPLIQTGDVANSGGYITSYKQTYSELGLSQSKLWRRGTLCITIAANIAKTGILTFDACFPDSIVGFIPGSRVTVNYVRLWLGYLQKVLEANAPESAQKNINLDILRRLVIPVPPYELQDQFESALGIVQSAVGKLKKTIGESEHLYTSLLSKYFPAT